MGKSMEEINVTELRSHMHDYLGKVQAGEEFIIKSRGKAIARIIPVLDDRLNAQEELKELRQKSKIGDILSPIGDAWEADIDNP